MGDNLAELQAMTYTDNSFAGRSYLFVVDICSNLQSKSGQVCYGDKKIEYQALKSITLLTKIATQFFSPESYLDDKDHDLSQ